MHVLMTVNSAWNIWNFRRDVVQALIADGHRVTVLAPYDEAVPALEELGCRVLPIEMSVKGLNPVEDLKLVRRFRRLFRCQSARKTDPLSASKIDPPCAVEIRRGF